MIPIPVPLRPSRDWRWNALIGLVAVVAGVLFLVRPSLALAVVAGTLGFSSLLYGGSMLRTAWDQREADLAYQGAARRVRYVDEPPAYQQAYQDPAGRTWVHVRRGFY